MASGLAEGWKELPTWAKWTVGLVSAGAVALFFLRARGQAPARQAVDRTPVSTTPQAPSAPSPTPAPSQNSGSPSAWETILKQLQTSQASLIAAQSQLAADIHMIAAHQLSPAAATGSTTVQLSGGMVASDKDGKGPGTSGAQYASQQPTPHTVFESTPVPTTPRQPEILEGDPVIEQFRRLNRGEPASSIWPDQNIQLQVDPKRPKYTGPV